MLILYMIFFLPQTLPDEILRWLGGGLNSLGDSTAVGAVQGALGTTYGRNASTGEAPGKLGGRGGGGSKPAPKDPVDGGGDGGNKTMTNAQGVEPNGGGGSGKGGGSRTVPPMSSAPGLGAAITGLASAKIGKALGNQWKQSRPQTPPTGGTGNDVRPPTKSTPEKL